MNYYPWHIGDYSAHTGHLSIVEDCAYRRLLDLYYLHQKPLPADPMECARLIRMRDHEMEVADVLQEFFVEGEAGWVNVRAEAEIAKMRDKQAKARASAQASVNVRRANAERTLSERSTDVELPTPTPTPTPNIDTSPIGEGQLAQDACPQQEIVSLFKERCPSARHPRLWSPARQALLRARWKEDESRQSLEWWGQFFDFVNASDFLMGRTHSKDRRPFELSLEWLCKSENFLKVLEGAYDNR